MRVASIDCGTNSTRLLVLDEKEVVVRRATITRLGRGIDQSQRLNESALRHNAEVLRSYVDLCRDLGVERTAVVATSAARDAANTVELSEQVRDIVGVELEVISGSDESELSFQGATAMHREVSTLMVDIGGGSTELAVGRYGEVNDRVSIDWGSVRVTERFLETDPPDPLELSQAVQSVRLELTEVLANHLTLRQFEEVIVVGGTATTAASIDLGLDEYNGERVEGYRLTKEAAEETFRALSSETLEFRRTNPGLAADRADVIVGGLVVLVVLFRALDVKWCRVSEHDLLDAIAARLLDD